MKKLILFILTSCIIVSSIHAQSYNQSRSTLANVIQRQYNVKPWRGVKVFLDYEYKYLISTVVLNTKNYQSENEMFEVADTKSIAQANDFLNGVKITKETIVQSEEHISNNGNTVDEISKVIKSRINTSSIGFVNNFELLTTFNAENNKVFIYLKELEKLNKKSKK
jgi:hypothetical protein